MKNFDFRPTLKADEMAPKIILGDAAHPINQIQVKIVHQMVFYSKVHAS